MFCNVISAMSRHPIVGAFDKLQTATPRSVMVAYAIFAAVALAIHHFVAEGAFSSVITMSSIVQCFGVSTLCIQVVSTGSAKGISAGSLILDAFSFGFRLASTTWLNGYLPVDKSGDYAIQIIDMCSLAMVLWLLFRVLVVHRSSYQADEDSFRAGSVVIVCFVLAAFLHADEDHRFLFDTFWMAGLFAGVLAVVPQLWLTTRNGGHVEALTSHYIAALALSRVLSGMFMWAARNTINCKPWISGVNHAVVAIFGAHALHFVLLADFAYFYMKSVLQRGVSEDVEMNVPEWI